SDSGKRIEAMYLFGKEYSADASDLKIHLDDGKPDVSASLGMTEIAILSGIGAAAVGASAYSLKGIRSKKN
ncbi:MAG TPA: hypothetical protein VFM64_03860, partial [Candidatus Nitrosotenuis sp.]|nr:hypothetical protein [Candidatus Nitrosotenuis sp.]